MSIESPELEKLAKAKLSVASVLSGFCIPYNTSLYSTFAGPACLLNPDVTRNFLGVTNWHAIWAEPNAEV
jgi:hypothetical protein